MIEGSVESQAKRVIEIIREATGDAAGGAG
jgi:hypothetical protein